MEGLNHKLDRIEGDLQGLVELYDFAEKLYPYDNLREGNSVTISRSMLTQFIDE